MSEADVIKNTIGGPITFQVYSERPGSDWSEARNGAVSSFIAQ